VSVTEAKILDEFVNLPIRPMLRFDFPQKKRANRIALQQRIEQGDDLIWLPNKGTLNCGKEIGAVDSVKHARNIR